MGLIIAAVFFSLILMISIKNRIMKIMKYSSDKLKKNSLQAQNSSISVKENFKAFMTSSMKSDASLADDIEIQNKLIETTSSSRIETASAILGMNNKVSHIETGCIKSPMPINEFSSTFLTTQSKATTANEYVRSLSKKVKQKFVELKFKYFRKERSMYFLIKHFLVAWLTLIQITCIHLHVFDMQAKQILSDSWWFSKSNRHLSARLCSFFDTYLFEELVYLAFAVVIFVCILFTKHTNRFNDYIFEKHKDYLSSSRYHKVGSNPIATQTQESSSMSTFLCRFLRRKKAAHMPSLSAPFSITNRAAASAVYILYTYDILNILMSVYTDNLTESFMGALLPNIQSLSGVIVDFLFQIMQVCLIGVKFYPILIALDLNNLSLVTNLLAAVYVLFIWSTGLVNKALCSTTQRAGFLKRSLLKLSKNLNEKLSERLKAKYELTSRVLSVISDEPNGREKYMSLLREKIPRLFNRQFSPSKHSTHTRELEKKITKLKA